MHAVDPVQRLRLLQQRLDGYTERAFHNEMILIFIGLRDLHTNYILPEPYRSRTAERFWWSYCAPSGPSSAQRDLIGKFSSPHRTQAAAEGCSGGRPA